MLIYRLNQAILAWWLSSSSIGCFCCDGYQVGADCAPDEEVLSYSHMFHCDDQGWDIGFTDSSNPFYLFSKMNVGLLLLAPSALRCDKSIPS